MPQIFTEVRPRDGVPDRQKDVGSPVDMLVDTVARMQLDLADLRAETGCGTPEFLGLYLDRRRSHGLMAQLVGNNTNRFSMLS